ncbi:hypothetical protein [Ruania halotolerans]|uniref:hypothetical protein n=1 Tax=Ruania halotolerans TaxID=2897773 RepID=UPI001E41F47E|nr:hypothetical protein [Ruania halotolerans]UFU05344.1 hypothetical protein LQF10_12875 [Ruania halotolerans]
MSASRRTFLGLAAGTTAALATGSSAALAAPAQASPRGPGGPARLTNLDHLRFLTDEVSLPELAHHRTFDQGTPGLAPWTYADFDGQRFTRVGGGTLDPATGHWTQGAYNADDIARAAVVFLRDWQASGDPRSRDHAVGTLRTLAYLQNDTGPDAGRVVLWQQSDGTLNPSAEPVELPDPSDSAESYWLARTVWAFGEGYAVFAGAGRQFAEFAEFLRGRLHLALTALGEESLARVGDLVRSDGVELPDWLIAGGADATAEAVLGLAAAHEADPDDAVVAGALREYAEGIARMGTSTDAWPFGAVLPWTGSLGFWHGWGAAAPEALARAGTVLGRPDLVDVAVADAGSFTPLLLATGGPVNAWAPTPAEAQIAYGVHGRVAAALAASEATGGPGLAEVAALAAGWFFGANPAGAQVYDPDTGITVDGIEPDGRINRNSGAESTIHALLTMLLLDEHPEVAAIARSMSGIESTHGVSVVEAEAATLSAGCVVELPDSGAWTGEGNLSGGAYVSVPAGEWVEFEVDLPGDAELHPIVWQRAEEAGDARWEVIDGPVLGFTPAGGLGDAGLTEAPGALRPLPLERPLPAGRTRVRCTSTGDLRLDGVLIRPAVASAVYRTETGEAALYVNASDRTQLIDALAGGSGRTFTIRGIQRGQARAGRRVRILGGGFSITR